MLERVGGGFVESPTKGSSPIHVVGRATSDDLLTRLERDLHDSHAIISDQQLQIASLSSEVSRRGATLEAHSRARGALQAEVDEARRYMAQSATQLASLRAAYEQLTNAAQTSGEAAAAGSAKQLAEATTALAEERQRGQSIVRELNEAHTSREQAMQRVWEEERQALKQGHDAETRRLEEGWRAREQRLEAELATAKAKAEEAAAQLERERARLGAAAADAGLEAQRQGYAADAARDAHEAARAERQQAESERDDLARRWEAARRELEVEGAARRKLEEWAVAANERLAWYADALATATAARDEAAASAQREGTQRAEVAAALEATTARLASASAAREQMSLVVHRASAAEAESHRLTQATADSAADAIRSEALAAFEARAALAEAHGQAEAEAARARALERQLANCSVRLDGAEGWATALYLYDVSEGGGTPPSAGRSRTHIERHPLPQQQQPPPPHVAKEPPYSWHPTPANGYGHSHSHSLQQQQQQQQQRGRYDHAQQPGVAHYNMYPLRTTPNSAIGVASVESLSRDITRRVLGVGAARASRA